MKQPAVQSPIASIVYGAESPALDASRRLLELGFHVPAIRPPTVPAGSSRLRVALSAAHTEEDVSALVTALAGEGGVGGGGVAAAHVVRLRGPHLKPKFLNQLL